MITITFKTPGVLDDAIAAYREDLEEEMAFRKSMECDSPARPTREEEDNFPDLLEEKCAEMRKVLEQYIEYGEYLRVRVNLVDKRLTVQSVRK